MGVNHGLITRYFTRLTTMRQVSSQLYIYRWQVTMSSESRTSHASTSRWCLFIMLQYRFVMFMGAWKIRVSHRFVVKCRHVLPQWYNSFNQFRLKRIHLLTFALYRVVLANPTTSPCIVQVLIWFNTAWEGTLRDEGVNPNVVLLVPPHLSEDLWWW